MNREGSAHIHETRVDVWEEDVDEPRMRAMLRGVLGHLVSRGWHMERDPHVVKNFPTLADSRYVGVKGDLRLFAEVSGRHAAVEFFQELNVENKNGGRYDFRKFSRLSRTMRLEYVVEMSHVARKLIEYGYHLRDLDPEDHGGDLRWHTLRESGDHREEAPLAAFNRIWKGDRFERDAGGWPTPKVYATCGYHLDRDKVPMKQGDTKFLRYKGRLIRATVYSNMNNMWMVTVNGTVLTYVANWELFDCPDPAAEPRRVVPDQARRLHALLGKATEEKSYRRAAAIARTLATIVPPQQVSA